MANLILPPPICDVYGIVHDMIPTVAPEADEEGIDLAIIMVQQLFSLCEQARLNRTVEKVFIAMFSSLVEQCPADADISVFH